MRFYRDTLGMAFPLGGAGDWREFELPAGGPGAGRRRPPPGRLVLALAVDDVDAAVAELRAKGVPILKAPFATDVCYQAQIQGPDGNVVMLHRRNDGTAG